MKTIHALFTAAVALATLAAHAAGTPPPVESFFRLPQYAQMRISPDGKHIAALAPVNGRQNVVVLDMPPKTAHPVTAFDATDVVWLRWLNDKRLLVRTGTLATRDFDSRGGALYAVDADGSAARQLSESPDERLTSGTLAVLRMLEFVRRLPGDGDDFVGQEVAYDRNGRTMGELVRVDSQTGRRTSLSLGRPDSGEVEKWVVDNRGVARSLLVVDKGRVRIWYRASADAPWQKLQDDTVEDSLWMPLAIAEDDATLYVSSRAGRDKEAIVRYDPAKRALGEVVAQHPQVNLEDLILDQGKVVGVRYDADRFGTAMFDPELARLQKAIDGAFPDAVNLLTWSRDRSVAVIASATDRSPGTFYLMDVKKGRIQFLADRAPWIDAKQMAAMRPVRYAARDGLEIPAYLTLPRAGNGKDLPMIVLVHGGPWIAGDTWQFDPEVQFFASRGYAVLQPNYRGTTRYGWKHFYASYGQWGLAMQDDISDGVKWAVDQGIADPRRVCIYGASYGGYAAMMALAKTPDLFRCGVDYVGVTDVPLLMSATWSDTSLSDEAMHDIKKRIGDPDRDAKHLAEISPVNLAGRIKAPVLMAYGSVDVRVPIEHGERMKSALEKSGAKPIWMVMDGEGHGFRDPANQKAFYEAVEKFFAENLAPK